MGQVPLVLAALVAPLLPAILMHGRKSAPLWYLVSAAAIAVELVVVLLIILNPAPVVEYGWGLIIWGPLIVGLVTVPIGILGIGMLVDRVVERFLLARSRLHAETTSDRNRAPEGGESQLAGGAASSPGGNRGKAVRAVAVVVVFGAIAVLFSHDISDAITFYGGLLTVFRGPG